jgi:hypothetical protein
LFEKKDTDLIPLSNIKDVPVAMFVGYDDTIADPTDANWTR